MTGRAYRGEDPMQMALFDAARGERFTADAKEWIRRNHGTWMWMIAQANRHVTERTRFSIGALVEEARWTKPVAGVDEYKCNNNIRAALARMLVEAVPACGQYIERRESVVDL